MKLLRGAAEAREWTRAGVHYGHADGRLLFPLIWGGKGARIHRAPPDWRLHRILPQKNNPWPSLAPIWNWLIESGSNFEWVVLTFTHQGAVSSVPAAVIAPEIAMEFKMRWWWC